MLRQWRQLARFERKITISLSESEKLREVLRERITKARSKQKSLFKKCAANDAFYLPSFRRSFLTPSALAAIAFIYSSIVSTFTYRSAIDDHQHWKRIIAAV